MGCVAYLKVTWLKSASVVISVAGVVLVSCAPTHTDSKNTHPAAVGYMWLMLSVTAYASYEVHHYGHQTVTTCISASSCVTL